MDLERSERNVIEMSNKGLLFAILSAFIYGFNVIVEKYYINYIDSNNILFLMYLGAGLGLYLVHKSIKKKGKNTQNKITKKDIPKVILIVLFELGASFFLIEALKNINASLVSLLSVFEIIATSIVAYLFFKDPIYKNELTAIIIVVIASIILNFDDGAFSGINISSILVIIACICWGFENNLTASISNKEPSLFTSIKCTAVAIMYLIIMIISGNIIFNPLLIIIGFFTYGLGILFYAISTRYLNASKATLVFSLSPIFSIILSVIIYKDILTIPFFISTFLMISAIFIMNKDIINDYSKIKKS